MNTNRGMEWMTDRIIRYITTIVTALVITGVFFCIHLFNASGHIRQDHVRVGFILDGDESAPYSANFINAIRLAENEYGERLEMCVRSNVSYEDTTDVIKELIEKENCSVIFSNSYGYGEYMKNAAAEYPDVEFCAATCDNANKAPVYDNYHTFMGEICEGRYIAGKVAGLKLKEMINNGEITEEEALIGYVGAFQCAEVISGYTAFFMGVRSECESAVMKVIYTDTWSDYALERKCAVKLIDEGCVIISQHSDTIGPAVACENADVSHHVYHVGYNQDMITVAPTASLTGCKIDWQPYIESVVQAMLDGKAIEDEVKGHVHGNDVGAGFTEGWVRMLDVNEAVAADGTDEVIEDAVDALKRGSIEIFKGDYTGVNPTDPSDTIDLKNGYKENENSSAPAFNYVLEGVITVEDI